MTTRNPRYRHRIGFLAQWPASGFGSQWYPAELLECRIEGTPVLLWPVNWLNKCAKPYGARVQYCFYFAELGEKNLNWNCLVTIDGVIHRVQAPWNDNLRHQ